MRSSSEPHAHFAPRKLSSLWHGLKTRLTPASHPSTTSESARGSSHQHGTTDSYYLGSNHSSHLPLELLDPKSHPSKTGRRGKAQSSAARRGNNTHTSGGASQSRDGTEGQDGDRDDEDSAANAEPVSHIVVDNNFDHFVPPTVPRSDSGSNPGRSDTQGGETSHMDGEDGYAADRTERSSISGFDRAREWAYKIPGYELVVDRLWPNFRHFFDSSFPEPSKEKSFQKETWFSQKQGALLSALFFLISWTLTVSLLPLPLSQYNWWAYFGLAGFFNIPLLGLVIFDAPRRRPWIWQCFLMGASWIMPSVLVADMYQCQYFAAVNQCGSRNFLNLFGFAYGQPVLSILALRQNRVFATAGVVQFIVLMGVLLVSEGHAPNLFYRNIVNFALFHAFLIGTSFLRERSDRQMFALRQQLKIQYRATQSAQVMERRAADSKKRFVSYIFHEVRVPLNTALLAVQNLDGENVFDNLEKDQADMVHGLMGSLTMMEKVLNDVLSFNRMESGKFTQARKPFEFHKSIQLVALSHRMQAHRAGIDLVVDLDSAIDKIGGVFIGDEMRLRQVASNLVSNSIKFTANGSVRIVTKLLYPRLEPTPTSELEDPLLQATINLQANIQAAKEHERAGHPARVGTPDNAGYNASGADVEKGSVVAESKRHSRELGKEKEAEEKRARKAVIRVEIHDTGVGLRKSDLVENRLFSPYVQTEIGRRQGGKGSGLGLALIRQIVKLSGGRLGVESTLGKGSMFWFELPYSLPSRERLKSKDSMTPHLSQTRGVSGAAPMTAIVHHTGPSQPAATTLRPIVESSPMDAKSHGSGSGTPTRPEMGKTESTIPLIDPRHSRRRSSDIAHETALAETFPAVESSPESETPSSRLFAGDAQTDPFRGGSESSGPTAMSYERPTLDASNAAVQVQPVISPVTALSYLPPIPSPPSPGTVTQPFPPAVRGTSAPVSLAASGRSKHKKPAEPTEPPLCVLVVDDDKLTRMLMSRMLSRLGHQVTTAENGRIALGLIRDSFEGKPNVPKFDAVFLDNQMPLMSGVEVAREVRAMGCPLFIVGCTGNALKEDQDEYIGAGADEIIPKPIHQGAIESMIVEARRRVRGETVPRVVNEEMRSD